MFLLYYFFTLHSFYLVIRIYEPNVFQDIHRKYNTVMRYYFQFLLNRIFENTFCGSTGALTTTMIGSRLYNITQMTRPRFEFKWQEGAMKLFITG